MLSKDKIRLLMVFVISIELAKIIIRLVIVFGRSKPYIPWFKI